MATQQGWEASKKKIEWGSQIRSYVFDDRRVKDHRTGVQTSAVEAVMDGGLDEFIKAYPVSYTHLMSAVASRGFDIPCGAFRVKELPDEEAVGLFDGDVSTVVYLPAGVAGFSADTGEERTFRGFAYTPDQSRWASGVVTLSLIHI